MGLQLYEAALRQQLRMGLQLYKAAPAPAAAQGCSGSSAAPCRLQDCCLQDTHQRWCRRQPALQLHFAQHHARTFRSGCNQAKIMDNLLPYNCDMVEHQVLQDQHQLCGTSYRASLTSVRPQGRSVLNRMAQAAVSVWRSVRMAAIITCGAALMSVSVCASAAPAADKSDTAAKAETELYVFNWSDYIDPSVITDFEKEYGIKVHYDVMYSNEVLEAKLMVGKSGYDIIAPSLHVLKRLGEADLLLPLDKKQLPNLKHMDKGKMAKVATVDEGNTYGIPYMELSTGLAYNERKVAEVMGPDFKVDSWDVLFKEEYLKKLSQCGVASLDSPSDMLCTALIYMGRNPESQNKQDYRDAAELLKVMGKYVRYFHSAQYSNDLAAGEICIAPAWAGDAQLANQRSLEAKKDKIVYVIPKEGALMGYDMLAITRDATNVKNAHLFLNYIMRPEVIAKISNYVRFANANADATPLVDPEITSNPGIYYDAQTLKRMHIVVPPAKVERLMTRTWNNVVSASAGK